MSLAFQVGIATETTYGTPVTPTRFYEASASAIKPAVARIESTGLRRNSTAKRADRFHPYKKGAAGNMKLDAPTKGLGLLLKHIFGVGAVGTVSDSNYTQTFTLDPARLRGQSFTYQDNRPFVETGADQAFTFHGGKITGVTFSCDVDGLLMIDASMDFEDWDTATALATASYPDPFHNFAFVGASYTIDGSATGAHLKGFKLTIDEKLNVDRRHQRGSALKKEPRTAGIPTLKWSATADFDDLTHHAKVSSAVASGAVGAIVATYDGPVAHGGTTLPRIQITLPAARWDEFSNVVERPEILQQSVGGECNVPAAGGEPITLTYRTTDAAH